MIFNPLYDRARAIMIAALLYSLHEVRLALTNGRYEDGHIWEDERIPRLAKNA